MRTLVFLICLLLKPLVHGDVFDFEQLVPNRIQISLHHKATGTYGLVHQGKQPSLNSLAKNYGGSGSNAFFKPMMSKNALNQQKFNESQFGSISEYQTNNKLLNNKVIDKPKAVQKSFEAEDVISTRTKLFGTDEVFKFKNDRVRLIGGQKPDNHALAGTTYHFESVQNVYLRNALRSKYPHGVPFNGSGLADFSRYALHKAKIEMTGKNWLDFSAANKAMGWKETPSGMTWHHHYDGL